MVSEEVIEIINKKKIELFTAKFIIKFMVKKSNLTEILFIISNLLSGFRRIEVQDKLRHLNFIEKILIPLFDLLFHPNIDPNLEGTFLVSENFDLQRIIFTTIE